ncbi:hypothetical protein SAMN05660909_01566 [Chitinophaga terrae (ex Kim and Jung 2007)]|uniref:Outer membrane beta-barrel protein n=1 Tax=Chitinophaga terrae (ex Kim and Jung 2007) TaxID=408074 RepID=A0A1H4ABC2_9BACT|nr:transporter [Chitinophaga terrae (ex Kim and Jung 2007)]MDQ0105934.1 hypothetical protein [Chitinophaga terrae (ex Kim and Jung 2007)]SEA32834.1 hypothetical protein SAMN05660909_01566 [Chitinophaga terrae (ex Kim and Jung 2007)]
MKRMRHLTLALSIVLCGMVANAQIQKGNIMVGGTLANLGLNFQKSSTQFSMDLTPKAAWFIKDGFALGGYVNLGLSTDNPGTNVNYGVGALARYFVEDKNVRKLEFSKRSRFFLEGTVGFAGFNPANGASTNGLDIGVGPGISYFITPNVGLEGLLKYDLTVGFGNSTTSNRLNLGVGFQIYLPSARAKQIYREERNR